jgi:hypothetical protein
VIPLLHTAFPFSTSRDHLGVGASAKFSDMCGRADGFTNSFTSFSILPIRKSGFNAGQGIEFEHVNGGPLQICGTRLWLLCQIKLHQSNNITNGAILRHPSSTFVLGFNCEHSLISVRHYCMVAIKKHMPTPGCCGGIWLSW